MQNAGRWRDLEPATLERWLARLTATVAPEATSLGVRLCGDDGMRAVNHDFRGRNEVTDVLSCPAAEPGELGDVVIAAGVAGRQARRPGHSIAVELRVLALPGLLHLLGSDHERDDGLMARLERRLRLKGGLVEGLIERGHHLG